MTCNVARFRQLLGAIIATVMEMGNFVLLLLLMMFIFTLLGQAAFATKSLSEMLLNAFRY